MFNVVDSSGNFVFEDDKLPTPLSAKVVSYAQGAYKVFIDSLTDFKKELIRLGIERVSALFNSRK